MTLTDFLIAFAAATLTGLGVGSGGLYLLWLTLFTDTPQTEAQGRNLIFCILVCQGTYP